MFLEVTNLNKGFGDHENRIEVLKNLSLNVEKKEFCVLLGPSGSGKSTLLNIIGLMDKASSGEYLYNGNEINLDSINSKDLAYIRNTTFGFIYQNFALIDNLTIKENLELPLKYRCKHEKIKFNKKTAQLKILDYLKKFNLEDKINRFPYELSGGEQQRIAIIRAIINDAKIILADEPTGALDSSMSDIVFNELLKLNKINKTVIIVTHDLNIANKCDRVINLQ